MAYRMLFVVAVVVSLSLTLVQSVAAHPPTDCVALINFDDQEDLPFIAHNYYGLSAPYLTTGYTGQGETWPSYDEEESSRHVLWFVVQIDPAWEIYGISYQLKLTGLPNGDLGHQFLTQFQNDPDTATNGVSFNYTLSPNTATTDWQTVYIDFEEFPGSGANYIVLYYEYTDNASNPWSFVLDDVAIAYNGEGCQALTRPLALVDEAPEYMLFDNTEAFEGIYNFPEIWDLYYPLVHGFSPYSVLAVSARPGRFVHAATDATVTSIRALVFDDCAVGFGYTDDTWETQDGPCNVALLRDADSDVLLEGSVDITPISVVTLDTGTSLFKYVVANAPSYVSVGDAVVAGCVLGETIAIEEYPGFNAFIDVGEFISLGTSVEHIFAAEDILVGFTIVTEVIDAETNEQSPILDDLTVYPNNDRPCNELPEFAECMGSNPRFLRDGQGWTIRGLTSVYFGAGGGATLNPGSEVFMLMALNDESTYTVTVGGIDIFQSLSVNLRIRIGTTLEDFQITPGVERVALEDATPTGSVADGIYEVALKNTSNEPVFVDFACVTEGAPPSNPGGCYFKYHSFDFQSAGWTNGGTVTFGTDGTANMPDDANGTLAQAVSLTAGNYTLSARVRPWYTIPADEVASPNGDVDMIYTFDSGPVTLDSLIWIYTQDFAILSTTFVLADAASGTITFELDINSGSTELQGLTIDRFCLEREGGYAPPGGGSPPPIVASCERVASPNSNDVPSWLSWQWAQFNRFFQCDLMILLNKMYTTFTLQIGTGLSGLRYFIVVTQYSGNWLSNEVFPYLGGHFANIANGRTTTVIEAGGGCHDLFCLLDNLISGVLSPLSDAINNIVNFVIWLLTQAASLIFTLVTSLLGLLVSVLTTIVSLFQTFLAFLQSLVTGLNNATPTPLPGVPQCQLDPQGNPICIALWILENTVFADEGQLYIPLLIGAISIGLIFWAVDTFRKGIGEAVDKL